MKPVPLEPALSARLGGRDLRGIDGDDAGVVRGAAGVLGMRTAKATRRDDLGARRTVVAERRSQRPVWESRR